MSDDGLDIVDAEIIEVTNLREIPRADDTGKEMALYRLAEANPTFDWWWWWQSLPGAIRRKDVTTFKFLIALGLQNGLT